MPTPRSLETFLVEEQLVDEQALRQARRVALRRRVALIEVLIDEHTLDEERLAGTLAGRLALPRVRAAELGGDEEALREVPHDLAAAHLCVPVRLDASTERRALQLAMANPLDTAAVEDVVHASGCQVEPAVSTLSEIRAAIQRSYRGMITKMIPRLPTADEARTAGEPTTAPHLQLPDERSVELRLRALTDLLVERGVVTAQEVEERVRRLVRGEDV
jgi:type IV pilus assembly protein PilB